MNIKKMIIVLLMMIVIMFSMTFVCASNTVLSAPNSTPETVLDESNQENAESGVINSTAAETTTKNMKNKDEIITRYSEKFGDETYGKVAYYMYLAQKYSIPACFVILSIGALNFFIIGTKKLDKKELGFKLIVGALVIVVIFQVLPLIFAIIVAER